MASPMAGKGWSFIRYEPRTRLQGCPGRTAVRHPFIIREITYIERCNHSIALSLTPVTLLLICLESEKYSNICNCNVLIMMGICCQVCRPAVHLEEVPRQRALQWVPGIAGGRFWTSHANGCTGTSAGPFSRWTCIIPSAGEEPGRKPCRASGDFGMKVLEKYNGLGRFGGYH